MEGNSRFDFCPKCGALARDGVCTSCGYQNPEVTGNKQQTDGEEQYAQEQQAVLNGMHPQQEAGGMAPPQMQQEASGMVPPQSQQASAGMVQPQMQQTAGGMVPPQMQQTAGGMVPPQMQQSVGGMAPPQMQQPSAGMVPPQMQQASAGMAPPQMQQEATGMTRPQQQGIPGMGQPQYGQGQPYPGSYQPYMQAVPMAKPVKKKSRTTLAVFLILGFVLLALVALILAGVYAIQKRDGKQDIVSDGRQQGWASESEEEDGQADENEEGTSSSSPSFSHFSSDVTQEKWDGEGQDEAYSYYTGPYNALRDDLSYELKFTRDTYSSQNSSNVFLQADYPQITTTDYPYREYINAALYYEYRYFMNFFKEDFKPRMRSDDDIFSCEIESYVTYMDEKTLSVVFKESIYLELENDPFSVFSLYCMNFDLETGNLIKNAEVLHVDDDFVTDFRQREIFENGDEALTDYSDQEIKEMLESDDTLVLFYTPMGLEVGLNLPGRIVYVTYEDYEQFLNSY